MSRRLLAGLAAAGLAFLGVIGPPQAVHAAAPVQVSTDERTWADRMTRPLFPSVERIVPGDEITDALWVKNVSRSPVDVTVGLRWAGPQTSTNLDNVLTIGMNGEAVTVGQLRTSPLKVHLGRMDPGDIAAIEASAHLPLEAKNPTQRQNVKVALVLQLSGDEDPAPSPTPSGHPTSDPSSSATAQPPHTPRPSASSGPGEGSDDGFGDNGPGSDNGSGDKGRGGDRRSVLPRTGTEAIMLGFAGLIIVTTGATAVIASRKRSRSH